MFENVNLVPGLVPVTTSVRTTDSRDRITAGNTDALNFIKQRISELTYPASGEFGYEYQDVRNIGLPPTKPKFSPFVKEHTEYTRPVPYYTILYNRIDDFNQPHLKYINKKAEKIVGQRLFSTCPKVEPISFKSAYKKIPHDTSPGWPFNELYKKKGDAKLVSILHAQYIKNSLKHRSVDDVLNLVPPCYAAARRALQKPGVNKSRLVWAYPMSMTLIESIFSIPLTESLKKSNLFGWSVNWLDGGAAPMYRDMSYCQCINAARFGLDWSSYDSRVQSSAIRWAFSVCRGLLDLDETQRKLFLLVEQYFLNTPILFRRKVFRKSQGVPSGSGFTQIIDSLCNMYIHVDLVLSVSSYPERYNTWESIFYYSNFLGDDSICHLRIPFTSTMMQRLESVALEHHNMVLSVNKSWHSLNDYCEDGVFSFQYLGKTISSPLDIEADFEKIKAAAALPEEPDKEPSDALTRLIGLMWSVGTNSKHFEWLLNKYLLILRKYPNVRPKRWRPSERRWLLFTIGVVPELAIPKRLDIVRRYASGKISNTFW